MSIFFLLVCTSPLSNTHIGKYLLLVCGLNFHSLNGVLWWIEVLNSKEVQFIYLLWLAIVVFYLRNICISQGYKDILLCFLLEALLFFLLPLRLWYILNSFLHMLCNRCHASRYLHMNIQLTQHQLQKRLSFPHWIVLLHILCIVLNYICRSVPICLSLHQ